MSKDFMAYLARDLGFLSEEELAHLPDIPDDAKAWPPPTDGQEPVGFRVPGLRPKP